MDNKNNDFSSWNVPKKKIAVPAAGTKKNDSESSSMNMTIPKKKRTLPTKSEAHDLSLFSFPRHPPNAYNLTSRKVDSKKAGTIPRKKIFTNTDTTKEENKKSIAGRDDYDLKKIHRKGIRSDAPEGHTFTDVSMRKRKIVSEIPFIVRLSIKNVPLSQRIPRIPTLARPKKRARKNYKEIDEDEGFLIDSDDETNGIGKKQSKLRKVKSENFQSSRASTVIEESLFDESVPALESTSVDSPPPGTLHTLWYSRECFLYIHVVEKIIGWKTRNVTTLEWISESIPDDDPPKQSPSIDIVDANKWSSMALTNPLIWRDAAKRMEVSRLAPNRCPIVLAMATATQKDDGVRFRINEMSQDTEEVYLVKWRGRSHMHCSWERGSDIIKFDQTKNTARHKIRRFVQSQEIEFGLEWKRILVNERAINSTMHVSNESLKKSHAEMVEEEHFPPANLEIERVLACDESEMDVNLFARQRGSNIRDEQERLRRQELGLSHDLSSRENLLDLLNERPWDPEDNVRYVVKWKGLPFAEMTWEYWRDIKCDAVNETEDFWLRQKPPPPTRISELIQKQHPHIRDFHKLQKSPVYGISKRERKVIDVGQTKEEDDGLVQEGYTLRDYQLEGVNWLLFNWWNKRSCILADEMGLGKTIQSMCFLSSLQELPMTDVRGPFLIVAPLSLIGQWQSEARNWAPDLNVVLYHGSADARDFLVKQDFYFTDQFVSKATAATLKKQHFTKFHILITTYEVVLKDVAVFSKIKWRALIVDEAHRLKNPKSKLFEDLGSVPRDFCLLLTGTPLANATEELWALLHFADPEGFGDKEGFLSKFGELKGADQVAELHTILKPYLLRRLKEDVEKALPPKEETILEVALTPIQKKYYKAIYERNTQYLYKGAKPGNAPSLMNVMMELRKCCNHPYLVRGAEERILTDAASQLSSQDDCGDKKLPINQLKLFGDQLIKSSGKMVLIHKLLPKLFNNGHKVLIFSQMVRVLDLLEELLKIMKYKYERLDGTTNSSARAAAVDRFCRVSCKRFVMLLSTRAGGLGLNLTAADVVIIFDSDWNPQNDLQAMARAHRIGQTRAVRVYRLLTAKTYEMHMFHSASMKLGLERAVLSQQRDHTDEGDSRKSKSKGDREAQAREIDSLLKKGAYDIFKEESDEDAQKFMETDIDQLLESNAQTVTYGSKDLNNTGSLGSFSKASFVTDIGDGETDVDLDDPDFWKKAAGLDAPMETPEDIAQMLDDSVKRSRKQVQQYNPFEDFEKIEQAKEDKRIQKLKEEKEGKELLRLQKRNQKLLGKEKKKEKEGKIEYPSDLGQDSTSTSKATTEAKFKLKKKALVLPTTKTAMNHCSSPERLNEDNFGLTSKKVAEKKRAIKQASNEDPHFERLKQAWDLPQRQRILSACLRFGFDRFCKIRAEANLTSLPIQDVEIFFRSFFYQISLQTVALFQIKDKENKERAIKTTMKVFLREDLGLSDDKELSWFHDCISNAFRCYVDVKEGKRVLRMPLILSEPSFVSQLRSGASVRALRRIFCMGRVNRIIEDCLDMILLELGHEQLGKRGCHISSLPSLDVDLKARLVSVEELSLCISKHLKARNQGTLPAAWWDRSCDIALVVGVFVHGLGSYNTMVQDETLPFALRINRFANLDDACVVAHRMFTEASRAAAEVFHFALDVAKSKDQLQIQAAVAAAAAASSKREKDAQTLREGGEAANAISPTVHDTPTDKLFEMKADDAHFVTLHRLRTSILTSIASARRNEGRNGKTSSKRADTFTSDEKSNRKKTSSVLKLEMPDSRLVESRLALVLSGIEKEMYKEEVNISKHNGGAVSIAPFSTSTSKIISATQTIMNRAQSIFPDIGMSSFHHPSIGLHGLQCGCSHRSLEDGSDFFLGPANHDLSLISHGTDAQRYFRAVAVPMTLTRFGVSSLVYADEQCVDTVIEEERGVRFGQVPSGGKPVASSEKASIDSKLAGERHSLQPQNISSLDPQLPDKPKKSSVPLSLRQKHVDSLAEENVRKLVSTLRIEGEELRAAIGTVVLIYGFPFNAGKESRSLFGAYASQSDCHSSQPSLFDSAQFLSLVQNLLEDDRELPSFSDIEYYVSHHLLPHCLKLCLLGNGPRANNARGSNGEFETSLGISLYRDPIEPMQCSLPDPMTPLHAHSVEAVAVAYAILRRTRLMKVAVDLVSSNSIVSFENILKILKSDSMRKSLSFLPVWWCPWIHDTALLVHAATRGLFALIEDRHSPKFTKSVFSHQSIQAHMRSTFLSDKSKLPRSVSEASSRDIDHWIFQHSKKFPSAFAIERRLAFLCSRATEDLEDYGRRYENLPMFDHGAWPRK